MVQPIYIFRESRQIVNSCMVLINLGVYYILLVLLQSLIGKFNGYFYKVLYQFNFFNLFLSLVFHL